jgi:hypothetical protein
VLTLPYWSLVALSPVNGDKLTYDLFSVCGSINRSDLIGFSAQISFKLYTYRLLFTRRLFFVLYHL